MTIRQLLILPIRLIIPIPSLLLVQFIGLFVVPIALLFTPREAEHLPPWALWWDNPDDGINGDDHWRVRWKEGQTRDYWVRFVWLALRNRASYFGKKIIGFRTADIIEWRDYGRVDLNREERRPGWRVMLAKDFLGDWYPMIQFIVPIGGAWCIEGKFGWKLWRLPRRDPHQLHGYTFCAWFRRYGQ
jgi:hypothetical protein